LKTVTMDKWKKSEITNATPKTFNRVRLRNLSGARADMAIPLRRVIRRPNRTW